MGKTRRNVKNHHRHLYPLFNEADANGNIRKDKCYPFGRRKYQVPTSRNKKKALELDNIEQIYYYQLVIDQVNGPNLSGLLYEYGPDDPLKSQKNIVYNKLIATEKDGLIFYTIHIHRPCQ